MTQTQTPKGNRVTFQVRPHVNDEALVIGILGSDEYKLAELRDLEGWALDIGAHVGTVGISLAVDHPKLNVICVEPVPDNAELIRQSARDNNVADRVHVIEVAAGSDQDAEFLCRYGYTHLEGFEDQQYVTQNAYIGNIWRLTDGERVTSEEVTVPTVTIDWLAQYADVDEFVYTKIDCEGCEWDFFKGSVGRLPYIVGEWHDAPFKKVEKLLGKTHTVEMLSDYGGSGIFRARSK